MLNLNQYVYCLLDKWHGLTIEDIRALEEEFKKESERIVKGARIVEREQDATPSSIGSAPI